MSDTTWGSEGCTAMYGKRSRRVSELAIFLCLQARVYSRERRHRPSGDSVVQRELARKQPKTLGGDDQGVRPSGLHAPLRKRRFCAECTLCSEVTASQRQAVVADCAFPLVGPSQIRSSSESAAVHTGAYNCKRVWQNLQLPTKKCPTLPIDSHLTIRQASRRGVTQS